MAKKDKKKKSNDRTKVVPGSTTTNPTAGVIATGVGIGVGAYQIKKRIVPVVSRGITTSIDASKNVLKSPIKSVKSGYQAGKNTLSGAYTRMTAPKGSLLPVTQAQTGADALGLKHTTKGGSALPKTVKDYPTFDSSIYKKQANKAMHQKLSTYVGSSNVVPGLTGTPEPGTVTKRGKKINYGKVKMSGIYDTPKMVSTVSKAELSIATDLAKANMRTPILDQTIPSNVDLDKYKGIKMRPEGVGSHLTPTYKEVHARTPIVNILDRQGGRIFLNNKVLTTKTSGTKIVGGYHTSEYIEGVDKYDNPKQWKRPDVAKTGTRIINLKNRNELKLDNLKNAESKTLHKNTRRVQDAANKQVNKALGYSKGGTHVSGNVSNAINTQAYNPTTSSQTTSQSMRGTNPNKGVDIYKSTKAQVKRSATGAATTKSIQLLGGKAFLGLGLAKTIPGIGTASILADAGGVSYKSAMNVVKDLSIFGSTANLPKSLKQAGSEVSSSWKSRGTAIKKYVTQTMPANRAKTKAKIAKLKKKKY